MTLFPYTTPSDLPGAELGIIQPNFDSVKQREREERKRGRTGKAEAATVSIIKPFGALTVGPTYQRDR